MSHTNKALVPFLLDEDYEKVIGAYSLRELGRGQSARLSQALPKGATPGSAPSRSASSTVPLCSRLRGGG